MTTPDPVPTAIRLDVKTNWLRINWSDGEESAYEGSYLRMICPCAACRGHGPGQVPAPTAEQCAGVRVTNAEGVGSYAIRFDFSDGHTTGIFAFDFLRKNRPEAEGEARAE
ncbi:MAG: DUF971 domain-containing protein [Planctomycetota bacterium]|nr:DUF971 domain-containing protein [Planctomycetota bacterium]